MPEEQKEKPERREPVADAGESGAEILEERYGPDALRELGGRAPDTAAATYTARDLEEAEEAEDEKWGDEGPPKGRTVEDTLESAREEQGYE